MLSDYVRNSLPASAKFKVIISALFCIKKLITTDMGQCM